jgi:hypothetical protein
VEGCRAVEAEVVVAACSAAEVAEVEVGVAEL